MKSRLRHHLGVAIVLGSALATPGFLAAAQPNPATHNAARRALAEQDYLGVINAYKGFTDLTPAANYRLSIAFAKTGDPVKAYSLLKQAIAEDPKGTFASSQQRLQAFTESLLLACESTGAFGCVEPETTATQPNSTRSMEPAAIAAPQPIGASVDASLLMPSPGPVTAPAASVSDPITPVSVGSAPANTAATPHPAATIPIHTEPTQMLFDSPSMTAIAVASLLGLMGAIVAVRTKKKCKPAPFWQTEPPIPANEPTIDTLEVTQSLHQAVQRQLQLLPQTHILSYRLQAILPLIEQEVGRAHLAKHGDASKLTSTDACVHQLRERHGGKPILISQATPEEVGALFQSVRWDSPVPLNRG